MQCPNCSAENPEQAVICNNCGNQLPPPENGGLLCVRISRLAVLSLVLALLSLPTMGVTAVPAFITGLIAIVLIDRDGGRVTGKGIAGVAVILAIIGFFFAVFNIVDRSTRCRAFRMVCGTNLSGMGKAMLIYANDYENQFPQAAGAMSQWTGKTPDWKASSRIEAFALHPGGTGGGAAISASLYLLVKYEEMTPKSFLCDGDKDVSEFVVSRYVKADYELIDLWDFGPEPTKHCSYAYHNPHSQYTLTVANDPRMAVAADRNPWQQGYKALTAKDWDIFDPNLQSPEPRGSYGNATVHGGVGQNILFLDSHVEFIKTPATAVDDDNIYTYWNGDDKLRGSPPTIGSKPASETDSLLVHDGKGVVPR